MSARSRRSCCETFRQRPRTTSSERVERAGAHLEVRHLANSAALLTNPSVHWDLVRPGLAVYGLSPLPFAPPAEYGLTPAMRLEADLLLTKRVPAGQGVSYGHVYTTPRETVLKTLALPAMELIEAALVARDDNQARGLLGTLTAGGSVYTPRQGLGAPVSAPTR